MLAPKIQAPLEDGPTSVDPPRTRWVPPSSAPAEVREPEAAVEPEYLGIRGDTGDRLARGTVATLQLRAKIAWRNHRIDASERAPPASCKIPTRVTIDWVRSRDAGQRIERIAPDTVRIRGDAAGRPSPRPHQPPGRSVTPLTPALSVAIDGLVHTIPVGPGETPAATARRLAHRLDGAYEVEIKEESGGSATLRIGAPILRRGAARPRPRRSD